MSLLSSIRMQGDSKVSIQLLNLREVRRRLPRSRSTIYSEIAKGLFPKPLKIGRGSFWGDHEVDDLIRAYAGGSNHDDLRRLCAELYDRRQGR